MTFDRKQLAQLADCGAMAPITANTKKQPLWPWLTIALLCAFEAAALGVFASWHLSRTAFWYDESMQFWMSTRKSKGQIAPESIYQAASALSAARGFLATMVNNERAAGSGRTRPCSQLRSVASGILSALANSVCVI
jgi:hypothetical protein